MCYVIRTRQAIGIEIRVVITEPIARGVNFFIYCFYYRYLYNTYRNMDKKPTGLKGVRCQG